MWTKEKIDQLRKECISRAQLDMLYLTRDDFAEELLDAVNYIASLQNEIYRLREGIECHTARSGEGTYECDIANPCPACRLRVLEKHEGERRKIKENADIERKEWEETLRTSASKSLRGVGLMKKEEQ